MRRKVYAALHEIVMRRVVEENLGEWRAAWDRAGKGSATRRAVDLRAIYEAAAPVPGTVNTPSTLALLNEMRVIVGKAIQESGGQMHENHMVFC